MFKSLVKVALLVTAPFVVTPSPFKIHPHAMPPLYIATTFEQTLQFIKKKKIMDLVNICISFLTSPVYAWECFKVSGGRS